MLTRQIVDKVFVLRNRLQGEIYDTSVVEAGNQLFRRVSEKAEFVSTSCLTYQTWWQVLQFYIKNISVHSLHSKL